ncbi:hypothetical protein C8Q78DRAFT_801863 [Trametes maxima]|nr:hypothetical protein C8Q78DRAFT_801863 [Trametes maxima]
MRHRDLLLARVSAVLVAWGACSNTGSCTWVPRLSEVCMLWVIESNLGCLQMCIVGARGSALRHDGVGVAGRISRRLTGIPHPCNDTFRSSGRLQQKLRVRVRAHHPVLRARTAQAAGPAKTVWDASSRRATLSECGSGMIAPASVCRCTSDRVHVMHLCPVQYSSSS